jgi:endonuclease/exonuclease/phosphatase (EEP) superfamily protein YafD
MAARIHRPLKIIAFNADGIWRQRHELSKELQDLYIDVALLSETHLNAHERFFIPNYHIYRTDRFHAEKAELQLQVQPQWSSRGSKLPCNTISNRTQVSQFGLQM